MLWASNKQAFKNVCKKKFLILILLAPTTHKGLGLPERYVTIYI